MTSTRYPYEPDEFDAPAPAGAPVGVHRAPRSAWSRTWPFLMVVVLAGALGVGAVAYVSNSEDPPVIASSDDGAATDDGETTDEPTDAATETPTDEPTDEPTETEEPTEEPTEETVEMPGDPALADLTARVVVYNDITTGNAAGQAGAAQGVLVNEVGFGSVEAADAPAQLAGVYEETTVLYADGRADTAVAVAEPLGVDPANVQLSDDLTNSPTDAVWVVLKAPVG